MKCLLFALVLCGLLFHHCGCDLYKILNVPRTVHKRELKKAYRELARKFHPDKNPNNPEADAKLKEVNRAYEILGNDEKRKIYDLYGEEGLKGQGDFDFGFSQSSSEIPRGGDIIMDLWVTLEELYNGQLVKLKRKNLIKIPASGTRKCNCHMELRTTMLGPGRFQMTQEQVCSECPNIEFVVEDKQLDLEIEPGMRDQQIYSFANEGEPHTDGESGDLKFRIRQIMHKMFHRRGDDLYTNVTLSLVEALNGYDLYIEHLDGHKVYFKSDLVTAPGTMIRKPNEGMLNYDNSKIRGSLYITFDVLFPQNRKLTDEEHLLVKKLFSSHSSDSNEFPTHSDEPSYATVYNGLDYKMKSTVKITN